jgi:hypothetical protein
MFLFSKKFLSICSAFLVFSAIGSGCSDDDPAAPPSGGGGGVTTDWVMSGAQVDTDFTNFVITLDENRNVTRVRYTFTADGQAYDYSGSAVTGDADLDGSLVTLDADWPSGGEDRELGFVGQINSARTVVTGSASYNVRHGSEIKFQLSTSTTLTKQ